MTKEINTVGDVTEYEYDGNGNLKIKKDEDGYVTEYGYDPRNLAETINYFNEKNVMFGYIKNCELVEMTEWNGTIF